MINCFSAVQIYGHHTSLARHYLRVYYKLIMRLAPTWLNSSVVRALHRYRRGHGFESRSSLNFVFRLYFHQTRSLEHYLLHPQDSRSQLFRFEMNRRDLVQAALADFRSHQLPQDTETLPHPQRKCRSEKKTRTNLS